MTTGEHRLLQLRLAAITTSRLSTLWSIVDLGDLRGPSVPQWLDLSVAVAGDMHRRSAAAARTYYRAHRRAVLDLPDPTLPVSPAFGTRATRTSMMVTGPVSYERAVRTGIDSAVASRSAMVGAARAGSRQALLGGRQTITQAVRADKRADGWIRVTGGDPCDFCVAQANRGAVYTAETVDFSAHANCACQPEPAFS